MMPTLAELRDELRARPVENVVNLAGYDPRATPFAPSKSDAKKDLESDLHELLFDQHELLFAEKERSVLLVLQGLDCSGKNGTIKHVVIACNPAGVRVDSFGEPTKEEQEHHFLWRFEQVLPQPGQLGVLDRSYYEDAIVPTVQGVPADDIDECLSSINAFEKKLVKSGTTLIKCMLHISYDEQRERFLRRLRRDDKRWKFSESDLETRRLWNEHQAAYGSVIGKTSPDHAPWFVIPADRKWYRNWVIGQLVVETIRDMGPGYPQPDIDLASLRAQLEPPL